MDAVILTDRLIIREFVPEDIDALYEIYDDPKIIRYIEPLAREKAVEKEKLESYIRYIYGFYGFGLWAVCKKDTGQLIGRCGLSMSDIDGSWAMEIGYMIGIPWQKQGYGQESVRAVLDYAGRMTDVSQVWARIHPDNEASVRLAVRSGFKKVKKIAGGTETLLLYVCELPAHFQETL